VNSNQNDVGQGPPPKSALPPGTKAPDFSLACTPDQRVSLNDFRGRPVILAFYPADWSPVCGDQMSLYNEVLPEFKRFNAELLGISVDGAWCHSAYRQNRNLHFSLLADFHLKGEVAKNYGVYREQDGVCERALFVIDGDGRIAWSYVSPIGVNPGADGILKALEDLSKQDLSEKEEARDGNQPGRQVSAARR
jgi:peroxiredoxin